MQPRILTVLVATVVGVLTITAVAAYATESAQNFVSKASVANKFEIESSKLALEKSQNKDIKAFAQRMIDDHTKAGEALMSALQASRSGAKASKDLDSQHQKLLEQLQEASGDDFNYRYVRMQTDAHKQAVSLFSHYASHGGDPQIKAFAQQLLPTLKDHLQHVEQLKISQ